MLSFSSPPHPTQQRYPRLVLLQSAARGTVHSLTRCPHHNHLNGKPPQTPPPQDKHKPRPPSSSPIYEAITEQLTLQASGEGKGKVDPNRASLSCDKVEQPPKLYARPWQPQPPVPPGYKRGLSKKGVSPEKTSRLAPIGGVTKLNPLMDEQNKLGSGSVEQGEAEEGEAELPTQAVSVCGGEMCGAWSGVYVMYCLPFLHGPARRPQAHRWCCRWVDALLATVELC